MNACGDGDAGGAPEVEWCNVVPHRPPSFKALSRVSPTLSEDLAAGMLRGVRVDRALRRFGAHWSGSAGSRVATAEWEYALSEPVSRLDDFITHDWSTGGWLKFFTLCVIYNSRAAMGASVFVAIVCGILTSGRVAVLPRTKANTSLVGVAGQRFPVQEGFWCMVLCPLVSVFMTFFWQRVRNLILRWPRYAFVDKLCINQIDEGSKRRGICSLAGFLKHSDRLVVLWSPKYFTRLWCAFEVAAWIHRRQDPQRSMHFMPVKLGIGLLLMHVAAFIVYAISRLAVLLSGSRNSEGLAFGTALILLCASSLGALSLANDLSELPRQLGQFSVGSAKCYCCENNHVHPATGARLPCDRELIYKTIGEWFGRGGTDSVHVAADLEAFDGHVRTRFREIVVASMGTVRMGYQQALFFSVPTVWQAGDAMAGWEQYPPGAALRELGLYACLWFCGWPCVGKIVLGSIALQGKFCAGWSGGWTTRALACLAVGLVTFAAIAALGLPLLQSVTYSNAVPQACISAAELLLTVALYAPGCWRRGRLAGARAPPAQQEGRGGPRSSAPQAPRGAGPQMLAWEADAK